MTVYIAIIYKARGITFNAVNIIGKDAAILNP